MRKIQGKLERRLVGFCPRNHKLYGPLDKEEFECSDCRRKYLKREVKYIKWDVLD